MTIVNPELIKGANNNSFFDRGSGLERDAQNATNSFMENFEGLEKRIGPFNDEQRRILDDRKAGWAALVAEQYNGMASFQANNVPWYIAGPAKYNSDRYNRKCDAAVKKFGDYDEKRERYIKNTADMIMKAMTAEKQVELWRTGKQGHGATIAANDPLAVEKMEAHVEYLKEAHERHIQWNKSIRKNGNADSCEGMSDKAKASINEYIKNNPGTDRVGYFFTSNETADIRNKVARLEQLRRQRSIAEEEKAEGLTLGAMEKDGLKLVENHEAARIQLIFEGKPDEETRTRLKQNGFRWSPRFGAWQRQNTPNGIAIARRFFEEFAA